MRDYGARPEVIKVRNKFVGKITDDGFGHIHICSADTERMAWAEMAEILERMTKIADHRIDFCSAVKEADHEQAE